MAAEVCGIVMLGHSAQLLLTGAEKCRTRLCFACLLLAWELFWGRACCSDIWSSRYGCASPSDAFSSLGVTSFTGAMLA